MFSRGKEKENIVEKILCEKYNSYYRMAMSYVHKEADALDIVQEGAYKAIKNSASLKNTDYAATWIYRIMLNEVYRFLDMRKPLSLEEETVQETGYEDVYEDIDLQRALDEMPAKDKAVIELKYFEDLKLEEIAFVLEENVNTVKSRLYRGLKKLRISLQEEEEKGKGGTKK